MSNTASAKVSATEPMHELVLCLEEQLHAGASFDNPRLTAAANKIFGGSRGSGNHTPRIAYDAMETATNRFLQKYHASLLIQAPTIEGLRFLRDLTTRLPTQSDRTEEQVELQQFSSPPPIAFIAARLLSPQKGELILEPSAGTGSLAIWPRVIGAELVCNEISERRRALLALLGYESFDVDAEFIDDLLPAEIKPLGVLMNPPFSSTAGRTQRHDTIFGANHIESALRRLEKSGRLVAISTAAMAMGATKFSEWWQRIAHRYNVRANYTISGREFAKQGTSVDVQIIVIDKDGSTPGSDWHGQLEEIKWGKAESLEEAWEDLKDLCVREPREEKAPSDEIAPAEMFVPYEVTRITGGVPHPAPIVESASMAAVKPPIITSKLALPRRIVEDGLLSNLQLESVLLAVQRHKQRLPSGARAGSFVGHGTGLGKGRIVAAIIAHNWFQGRRRSIWFSVNNDLIEATRRDLKDLGVNIPLGKINDYPPSGDIKMREGVLFCTYPSLISKSKDGKKRLDQIQRWLGKDAIVILDESHRAKNALVAGRGEPTQTGQAVIDLQSHERNPDYRVVYSSATGATEVRHMAYMIRLGLWGPGTPFSTFNQFMIEVEGGGVGAMEMVSRDLKTLGMYTSGSISFGACPVSGLAVEYREVIHHLTPDQREMYDNAARAWQVVMQNIEEAVGVTNGGKRARSRAISNFWASQQRFAAQLILSLKIPTLIKETEQALADGKAVIISLVGTGEARTIEKVSEAVASDMSLDDLDFTPREVICEMVRRSFPVILHQTVEDPTTGNKYQEPVKDKNGNLVECREAVLMRDDLLERMSDLNLPENPLDQIVNYFGENKIAEITGRKRRLIRDPRSGKTIYKKRAPQGVAMDRVNVHEMNEFQDGRKDIVIISDAGSTGISLHDSNRAAKKRRRVHITAQYGWVADREMQRLGRSHRSDQATPPEYVLLSTELGGERRFSSTIAKRLGTLGALTKSDRRAADANEISKYNFETEEGRAALTLMFRTIMRGESVLGLDDTRQTLRDMGLLTKDAIGQEYIRKEDEGNVPRFLNRVLALDVTRQNAIFKYFESLFERAVLSAKENGTFDEGVMDIQALAVRLAQPPRVVAIDHVTGAKTMHYLLDVDQATERLSFEEAEAARRENDGQYYLHVRTGKALLAIPSRQHTDPDTGKISRTFSIWRPERRKDSHWKAPKLTAKCHPLRPEEAREWWEKRYAELPAVETTQTHIIGGAILPLWQRLKSQDDVQLRVVRVTTSDGQRIVGATIPEDKVGPTLRALGISRHLIDPGEIWTAVWEDNDRVQLVEGLVLRRTSVHREPRIEICQTKLRHYGTLRTCDLIEETIKYKQRFFISSEQEEGTAMLTKVLAAFPPIKPTSSAAEAEDDEHVEFVDQPPVNIFDLLLPVAEDQAKPQSGAIEEKTTSAIPSQSNKVNAPMVNSGRQRPTPKTRKTSPGKTEQLAFNFNNAETTEGALEALSAMIAKAASKK
jgi:predicted RNA methylase